MMKALRSRPDLSLFGGVCLALGVIMLAIVAPAITRDIGQVEALPPLDREGLARTAPGSAVLVEGRLSDQMRPRAHSFVAYIRSEFRGTDSDNEDIWREDERHLPPLLLELAGGDARVANGGYALAHMTRFQDGPRFWNPLLRRGTKRYKGITRGAAVVAVGVKTGEGPTLAAATVAGGSKESYLGKRRRERLLKRLLGAALLLGGLISLGVVLRSARRAAAPPAPPEPPAASVA